MLPSHEWEVLYYLLWPFCQPKLLQTLYTSLAKTVCASTYVHVSYYLQLPQHQPTFVSLYLVCAGHVRYSHVWPDSFWRESGCTRLSQAFDTYSTTWVDRLIGLQLDVSRSTAWLHTILCVRVLEKLWWKMPALLSGSMSSFPLLERWGTSCLDQGHLDS